VIGNPLQVADVLESWFRSGAADGFNVMPPFFPGQFDAFVERVVPILQEHGRFRTDYAGRRCASISAWNAGRATSNLKPLIRWPNPPAHGSRRQGRQTVHFRPCTRWSDS
jgi:hypothetical protein